MSEKVGELIEELSQDPVNILRIKILCRDNPGLIASAGIRSKVWTLILLGNNTSSSTAAGGGGGLKSYYDLLINKDLTDPPTAACQEQHVLEADVHRTRADVEDFKSTTMREALTLILQKFCVSHHIQYKQGMNEVLAPFLYILPPIKGALLPYLLFEAFVVRYLQRFMCLDDSSYLFKAFRLFHVLLLYFDPQLALHLHDQEFTPELYTPQWFLTLYSRSLPLQHVVRLWDMMIAVDDPSFTFFIGFCLLRKKRSELLLATVEHIPEIMSTMKFKGEEEIDGVVTEARELYRTAPRCFLRYLRLCCVSTTELMPLPSRNITLKGDQVEISNSNGSTENTVDSSSYSLNVDEYERVLSLQAARCCLMLSARELVDSIAPILSPHADVMGQRDEDSASNSADVDSLRAPTQQYVIIDVRSYQDTLISGGGSLPRAIQLEPEFLNRPDSLSIWMQHFDGTRGCNICIIDVPPAKWTGFSLWRRLLWGEGDGDSATSERIYDSADEIDSGDELHDTFSAMRINQSDSVAQNRRLEVEVSKADRNRPAVQLALALQQNSFPNVSVLDGGFPALVEQLMSTRNTVEPVIINHDSERWIQYLRNTGRDSRPLENYYARNVVNKKKENGKIRKSSSGENIREPRSIKDLTQHQIYEYALRMAERLGHTHMAEVIRHKLEEN